MLKPHLVNVLSHLDPRYGGVSTSLPLFSRAIVEHTGWDTTLVAFVGQDESIPATSAYPLQTFPLGASRWVLPKAIRTPLEAILRSATIVQIHGIWQEHCAVTARLCRKFQIPYVVAAHGMLEPWALRQNRIMKQVYWRLIEKVNLQQSCFLRSLTAAESDQYRTLGLTPPIIEVPNGVVIPEAQSPEPFLNSHPHLRGRRLLLFLGRLHPKKGVHLLCQAWSKLAPSFPDTVLVLAGPDSEGTRAALERLVQDSGIASQTCFTGMLNAEMKWSALAAAYLFLLPSYSEGFSVAVLEALASGLPTLLTRTCYFPQAAAHGCGWEIEPEQKQLEEALAASLSESSARRELRCHAARSLIERHYTWPVIARHFCHSVQSMS